MMNDELQSIQRLLDTGDEMIELWDNDNPSKCEHGYSGWCPFCTPPAKTAETTGLPVSSLPTEPEDKPQGMWRELLFVAAFWGCLIWVLVEAF